MKPRTASMVLGASLFLAGGPLAAFAQAQETCGGAYERACCALERFPDLSSCNPGLTERATGWFPDACSGLGAGTCLPMTPPSATPCGGEGQRSCCAFEGTAGACQPGLGNQTDALPFDLFDAVSGDATCGNVTVVFSNTPRSVGTCISQPVLGPPVPGDIPEPVTGWTPAADPRGALRGYADMHLHLFGHMAHGGKNLSGLPAPVDAGGSFTLDGTYNVNTALSPATDLALHKTISHGLLNDTSGDGTQDGTRSWFGAPYFSGWPKWTSTTHQQAYYVWLERAWRGGLRATTLLVSHVEALCKTSLKATRATSWPDCEDSMRHIVEQLKAARDFQRFVDSLSGGPGTGWFRIVTTPQQAREVIRQGKLAVVLGIEVDNLFNCKEIFGCPADFGLPAAGIAPLTSLPQPTTLEEAVDVLYDIGVRHIFPVHNFDNGFGAAATWMDPIAVGQAVTEQRWWVPRDCGVGNGDYAYWIDNFLGSLMLILGFGVGETPAIPDYINGNLTPSYASCNAFGLRAPGAGPLFPGGQRLIQALMRKGMLIDIDHMSAYSVDQTIALAKTTPGSEAAPYPLVAGHVQFFDLHREGQFRDNKGRHERMRTRAQLDAIRAGGGMVAAMLKDDVQDTDLKGEKYTVPYTPAVGPAVADNCRHSSKTWGQALQYAVDVMDGPVAMGSDFNGQAGHVGPRFGSDACGGWGTANGTERLRQDAEGNRVEYPFTVPGFGAFEKQVTGFKAFDYNVDGLAHVGLLPDMVADLQKIGVDQHYLDQLFCSAEAYVRVWERAEALAAGQPAPDPNRPWLCNVVDDVPPASTVALAPPAPASGWHRDSVAATITAVDGGSGVESIAYTTTFEGQASSGGSNGDHAGVTIAKEGETVLSYFATDNAGNVEAPHAVTVKIDRTAPEITASRAPVANGSGWNKSAVTVTFTCTDALSGIASCSAPHVLSGEGQGQSAAGQAVDAAGNEAGATAAPINIDLTPPAVAVTGVADGAVYLVGSVPAAGCSTADGLSGVATPAVVSVTGGTANGVGAFSVSCSGAMDVAGNPGSAGAAYVVHYPFSGFVSPVDNPPVLNELKAGQTVPLKFGLGGDHGLGVLMAGSPASIRINCTAGGIVDPLEATSTPGSTVFAYDTVTMLYQYNWKTDKSWIGCRRLVLKLDDGTVHEADFRFK